MVLDEDSLYKHLELLRGDLLDFVRFEKTVVAVLEHPPGAPSTP